MRTIFSAHMMTACVLLNGLETPHTKQPVALLIIVAVIIFCTVVVVVVVAVVVVVVTVVVVVVTVVVVVVVVTVVVVVFVCGFVVVGRPILHSSGQNANLLQLRTRRLNKDLLHDGNYTWNIDGLTRRMIFCHYCYSVGLPVFLLLFC
ncbi:hypothetical protein Tco_0331006 [Tanacetum coccineum]